MARTIRFGIAALAACVALGGCAPAQESSAPATGDVGRAVVASETAQGVAGGDTGAPTAATDTPSAQPPPDATAGSSGDGDGSAGRQAAPAGLAPVVARAVRDLARRLDVPPDQIRVVRAERVVWPDQTLGCPLRGGDGLGGPQRGVRVHLRFDDLLYRYHTGTRRDPFLCDPAAVKDQEEARRIEP